MKTLEAMASTLLLTALIGVVSCGETAAQGRPYSVEYYYKVRWGHFDEFLELYKRNHYPVLVRLKERGDILDMWAASPVYHAGEETRWDFRFTIVWKDVSTAFREDRGEDQIVKDLYPDQDRFRQEEQRRFQLLVQHLDVPVRRDALNEWKPTP